MKAKTATMVVSESESFADGSVASWQLFCVGKILIRLKVCGEFNMVLYMRVIYSI